VLIAQHRCGFGVGCDHQEGLLALAWRAVDAGIVLALSIRIAVAGEVLLFDFEGYVGLLLSRDLILCIRCKAHGDGQQATRGGLLRCVGPYGGRALGLGCCS
jgi:hypothetical protein